MKRLALFLCLIAGAAFGQSSPNWPLGYKPTMPEWNAQLGSKQDVSATSPVLQATAYGVKADGVTSNDQALGKAFADCTRKGATLQMPPGKIRLTGVTISGGATRLIQNCAVIGSGVPGLLFGAASPGTVIELASTSVAPFILGQNCAVRGINFYWPVQNGATVYPPLFSDGAGQVVACTIDGNTITNAYDIFKQGSVGWGANHITNNTIYAVHVAYILSNIGDGFTLSNNRYTPQAWLSFGGDPAAVGHAAQNNTLFDGKPGGTISVNASNEVVVGWRCGICLENGAVWAESQFNATWDAVGTIIDTTAGGAYPAGNTFTGQNAACSISNAVWGVGPNGGNRPCFKMGGAPFSELNLNGFQSGGSQGDFISTAGADVTVTASESFNIGSAIDGNDYYQVHVTGGTPRIRVQSSHFGGINGSAKTHGITAIAGFPSVTKIQDNLFEFLNDDITIDISGGTVTVTGNTGSFTHAAGLKSFNASGVGHIVYDSNDLDSSPPTSPAATVTNCGGSDATVTGTTSGLIGVGSTNPTTSCTFTLPFSPVGSGGGNCVFTAYAAVAIAAASVGGNPPVWNLTFADLHGSGINYSCRGTQ